MKIDENETAVKFLLGKLSEEEQTKIEEDYFNNNALFEDIQIAENDLIDAFVASGLSTEDRQRFENRLLLNPQQRQRVEFAKTLFRYAANQNSIANELTIPPAKSKWASFLSQLFSVKPMYSLAFAAIALVVLSVGVWVSLNNLENSPYANQTDELAQIQTPEPTIQQQESANETNNKIQPEEQKTPAVQSSPKPTQPQSSPKKQVAPAEHPRTIISTIVLPLGATRDAETAKVVEIPREADLIKLQLKFEAGDFASFSAVLETVEGQQIWSGRKLKPAKSQTEKVVTITIPSRLLKKGDYIISLKGLTNEGNYEGVGDYSFTVSPK